MDSALFTSLNEGGDRPKPYLDSRGIWTIATGCSGDDPYCSPDETIGPNTVWSDVQRATQFRLRLAKATAEAEDDVGTGVWLGLDEVRRAGLADMAFQLGGRGLSQFVHMLAAVRTQSWQMAHDALLDSAYAHQTPARAQRNAAMLLTGQWPATAF